MNRLRPVGLVFLAGFALSVVSILVARPVSEGTAPAYLRGAPVAYAVDLARSDLGPAEADVLIIPDEPQIGPIHVVPFAYDWLFWSAVLSLVGLLYWIGRAALRVRATAARGSHPGPNTELSRIAGLLLS